MNLLRKIWNNPVWSKVIAYVIINLFTSGVISLTGVKAFFESLLLKGGTFTTLEVVLITLLLSFVILLIGLLVHVYWKKNLQKRYHNFYHSKTGKILPIADIDQKSPLLTKIAVAGLGDAGKTTLIENLCNTLPKGERTSGKGGYVVNLSTNSYNYAAILDGSGQSIPIQNSLITKANIIIFVVDHNIAATDIRIDERRVREHISFIQQAVDHLLDNGYSPRHFYLLLNKRDKWNRNSEFLQDDLIKTIRASEEMLQEKFPGSNVIFRQYSNENSVDVRTLRHNLINRL